MLAVENDVLLAACMAVPSDGKTWELCKLCSNKNVPHKGAGSAVFKAAMDWALNHGAERLFILSNSSLKPAIHIYNKYGFKEIKLENYEYIRGDIAFEYRKGNIKEMKAVVKKEDAVKRIFKGVSLDSLALGEKSQVTKMNYVVGNYASPINIPMNKAGTLFRESMSLRLGCEI